MYATGGDIYKKMNRDIFMNSEEKTGELCIMFGSTIVLYGNTVNK